MAKKNSVLQTLVSEKATKKTAEKTAEKEQKTQAAADNIPNIYALGKSEDGYIIVKDAERYFANPAYKKAIRKLHKMKLEATVENAAKAEQILAEAGLIRRTKVQQNSGERRQPPKFTPQVFENIPTGPDGAPETWVQMRPNAKPVGNFILIVAEIEVDEVKEVKTKSGKTKMKRTGNKIKQNSYRLYYCMDFTESGAYLRDVHTGESLNLLPEEIKKGVVYAPKYDDEGNETNEVDRNNIVAKLYVVQPQKTSAANA